MTVLYEQVTQIELEDDHIEVKQGETIESTRPDNPKSKYDHTHLEWGHRVRQLVLDTIEFTHRGPKQLTNEI